MGGLGNPVRVHTERLDAFLMKAKGRVLIVSEDTVNAAAMVGGMNKHGVEAYVAHGLGEAVLRLKEHPFDVLLLESDVINQASGLNFAIEARKHLPNMMRIVYETKPLQVDLVKLVNELAPRTIFKEKVDVNELTHLLEEKRGEPVKPKQEEKKPVNVDQEILERLNFVTRISVELNSMIEEPNISLPVLPEIADKVRNIMSQESYTFESVAEFVEVEQGMSARILQVANSAIYAGKERIYNLQQAVGRLGLRETRNILQAVIAENLFNTDSRQLEEVMKSLWLHSICCAYCNEIIAQTLEIENSDDYFMMGLLHDLGKLLILHLIEQGRKEKRWGDQRVTLDVVKSIMAMRHHDMGARLLQKWHYPMAFQEVVRLHNDDDTIHTRTEPVVVTYASNLFTRKLGIGIVEYDGNDPFQNRLLIRALNLEPKQAEEIERILQEVTTRIRKSCFASPGK